MASCRVPLLRHLAGRPIQPFRVCHQRRWAQVHDVRFLATTQQPRSVFEKYRDKLDRKAREEGHPDIGSLQKAYAEKIQHLRKQGAPARDAAPPGTQTPEPSASPPPPRDATTPSTTTAAAPPRPENATVKPLSALLDLPKARALPVKELTAVWRLRHADVANSLCAVIPAPTYTAMEAAACAAPQFVLPVPHAAQGGAELHFLQWTFDPASHTSTVLFTQLAEYKVRGEFAQPHTTVTHHADLAAEKGVVLMHGAVMDGRGVSADDARWLVMCLQRFYGGWDGEMDAARKERALERRKLLEWFATGDERFSVERLMEEAERLG